MKTKKMYVNFMIKKIESYKYTDQSTQYHFVFAVNGNVNF